MSLTVHCPQCRKKYDLAPERAGQKVTCVACRLVFLVPAPQPPAPAARKPESIPQPKTESSQAEKPAQPSVPSPLSTLDSLFPEIVEPPTAPVLTPVPSVRPKPKPRPAGGRIVLYAAVGAVATVLLVGLVLLLYTFSGDQSYLQQSEQSQSLTETSQDSQADDAASAKTSEATEISVDLGNGVMMEMVRIPAGEFLMGSPPNEKDRENDEGPVHRVRITRPFYLGKYEVTEEQWQALLGVNPRRFQHPKNPVGDVSWQNCEGFFNSLNERYKGTGVKFGLPTEAQWEYACRARSTGRYCYGDDESALGDYAWYAANSGGAAHPVGQKKPNAWGLYDMHGNVWEWCEDDSDTRYYSRSHMDDPLCINLLGSDRQSGGRVHRGDSWNGNAVGARSANRNYNASIGRVPCFGFRVARTIPDPLRLKPVDLQTVEVGNTLVVEVGVQDADNWQGTVRYSLAKPSPAGASIDEKTGRFTWTPSAPGVYDVMIAVKAVDGQRHQQKFSVAVPAPVRSLEKRFSINLGDGAKMEMALIPSGEFQMGSPEAEWGRDSDEGPIHRVRITRPFYLGVYEVTQQQYEQVMGSNPSYLKGATLPVEQVSWTEALEFCRRLSAKEGREYRLPTEAQWEYACRAGATTRYWFGDSDPLLAQYAWYDSNSERSTHPVGEKSPNAFGLYDMHGSVCEWCADWHAFYPNSPVDDPTGATSGLRRVYRGGAWTFNPVACRAACRRGDAPASRYAHLGFRVSGAIAANVRDSSATPLQSKPSAPQSVVAPPPLPKPQAADAPGKAKPQPSPELPTSTNCRTLQGHRNRVSSLAYSPDGSVLASGSQDGAIKIWDPQTGQALKTLEAEALVCSVAVAPDGRVLASGCSDGAVKLWDLQAGKLQHSLHTSKSNAAVLCVEFSPDGRRLAASNGGQLVLWSMALRQELLSNGSIVSDFAFSPDGRSILIGTACKEPEVFLSDAETGKAQRTLYAHERGDNVTAVAFAPDGRMVASASAAAIKLWSVHTSQAVRSFNVHDHMAARIRGRATDAARSVYAHGDVAFSPDSRILAYVSDTAVNLVNVETGKLLLILDEHGPIAFSPDGRTLACVGDNNTIKLCSLDRSIEVHPSVDRSVPKPRARPLPQPPDYTELAQPFQPNDAMNCIKVPASHATGWRVGAKLRIGDRDFTIRSIRSSKASRTSSYETESFDTVQLMERPKVTYPIGTAVDYLGPNARRSP